MLLQRHVVTRAVPDANKLLKRPELKRPEPQQKKLFDESTTEQPSHSEPDSLQSTSTASAPAVTSSSTVTIEYQRQRAKEMRKYFQDMLVEEELKKSQ
eukprot:jgi/Chrzof1/9438/Cz04g03040.t1